MNTRKKILIVDDERGVRELLSESLSEQGYETLTAVDGPDALAQAERSFPDLILLDLGMPKMDGWGVLSRLYSEEKTRNIPVVVITGRTDTESLLKPERKQTLEYFFKPIDLAELHNFIKSHIS